MFGEMWGTSEPSKDNVESLRADGAFFEDGRLRNVVRDAISILDSLGYRYLWVDALCVIQDDPSKMFYVQRMDIIYTRAICTIVAAGSSNADQPVWGVREGSRPPVKSEFHNGCSLVRVGMEADEAFSATPSESRSWTLQERLLSPRLLVFTQSEIFLQCSKEKHQENPPRSMSCSYNDSRFRKRPLTYNLFHGMLGRNSDVEWKRLRKMIKERPDRSPYRFELIFICCDLMSTYTYRSLTREDDVYNAFMGIENHVSARCGAVFLSAIPIAGFPIALMWYSPSARSRRRVAPAENSKYSHELPFPSWSWIAWTEGISWASPLHLKDSLDRFKHCWAYSSGLHSSTIFISDDGQRMSLHTAQVQALKNPRLVFKYLEFQADSVPISRFGLRPLRDWDPNLCAIEIHDSEGNHCGAVLGVSYDNAEKLIGTELVEIFATSRRSKSPPDRADYVIHSGMHYYSEHPLVNCLVIKWDEQFAKRVAVAQVHQDAWRKSVGEFKRVVLV
ncbi:heterokaryon incompatibility protein-domain-containing protein [Clohesyomyces aquaticus]|uniref:Heterokaryon incompatibility protein-domain-containing protein n=1 Tax=Clohesyomyces aquaticus TaxID=1231657 RepID=A0A1Y1Z2Q5_9PLEO|nr:heterokaryon incompatibility protein-domain-containing protein [Clohesyomyces aquaticus]